MRREQISKIIFHWGSLITMTLLFSACLTSSAADLVDDTSKKPLVFLLAGQSNMDGRGDAAQLTLEDRVRLAAVQERVNLYYNHQPVRLLQAYLPLAHTAKKFQLDTVFGPELFFGIQIAEAYPDREIILIKRAKGGTSLYGCWNSNWTEEKARLMGEADAPRLFRDFVDYTKEVLASRSAGSYELAGMLWVQGETDSGKRFGTAPAASYGENLTALIGAVRTEFATPRLPFVLLQVGGGKVVTGMQSVAVEDDRVWLIPQQRDSTSPYYYPKYGPPVGHYNYTGMKRIGEHFAQVYLEQVLSRED